MTTEPYQLEAICPACLHINRHYSMSTNFWGYCNDCGKEINLKLKGCSHTGVQDVKLDIPSNVDGTSIIDIKSAVDVVIKDSTLTKIAFVSGERTSVYVGVTGLFIGYARSGVTTILNIHTHMKNVEHLIKPISSFDPLDTGIPTLVDDL